MVSHSYVQRGLVIFKFYKKRPFLSRCRGRTYAMWKFFCNIFGCHRNLPTGCECLIRSIHWWSRTKVVAILHKNGEGTLLCKVFVQVFNVWRCILSIISMNSLPFRFTRLQTMWGNIWSDMDIYGSMWIFILVDWWTRTLFLMGVPGKYTSIYWDILFYDQYLPAISTQ